MKYGKFFSVLLIVVLVFYSTVVSLGAGDDSKARVVFKAGEPDANGLFSVTLTIYNAKFNAFQFVLRYDSSTVVPINSKGEATSSFSDFASKAEKTNWMSTVGTSIDTNKGLIDFTGYVSPGASVSTDGLAKLSGYANIGKSGVQAFSFSFKKSGNNNVSIEIAKQDAQKSFSKFLPEGGVLIDAGYIVPTTISFELPASIGVSHSVESSDLSTTSPGISSSSPSSDVAMTKAERLKGTIALQIGNYGAAEEGALYIDAENKAVVPYIDENGRTMVPVRFIAERLGAKVAWDPETRKVTIKLDGKEINMSIGSTQYSLNGENKYMDTAPTIKTGWNRTMVPIRFVAEALGKSVEWDKANKLVFITPVNKPWELEREGEKEATNSILMVISPLIRDFIL